MDAGNADAPVSRRQGGWYRVRHVLLKVLTLVSVVGFGAAARAQCDCYKETVIDALPPPASASGPMAMLECDNCDVWLPPLREKKSYYLHVTGGASYLDSTPTTSGGGLLGIQGAVPLAERTGLLANGSVNVYDGGTIYSGGLGAYRNPWYYGSVRDRFGGSVVIYQFTDTRIGNPYLVFGTYSVNYAVLPGIRAGVKHYDPIHGGDANLPGGSVISGGRLMTPLTEATLSMGSVRQHLNLAVGYAHDLDSSTYALNIARPVTSRVSTLFDVFYAERTGYWWGYLGVQFDLSPRDNMQIVSVRRRSDVLRGDIGSVLFSVLGLSDMSEESGPDNNDDDSDDAPSTDTGVEWPDVYNLDDYPDESQNFGHCDCPEGYTFISELSGFQILCHKNGAPQGENTIFDCPD